MSAVAKYGASRARSGPRVSFVGMSVVAATTLVAGSWAFILLSDTPRAHSYLSAETFSRAWSFVKDLLGVGSTGTPAYLDSREWVEGARLAYRTLAMSVLGIGFAALVALATFIFGARNVMAGELASHGAWAWRGLFLLTRASYIVTRGVPELIWAMLIVFVLSPGILPGAVALGLHNAGVLGKLASETVEGLDTRPLRSLRSAGAGRLQVVAYGVLPQALPRFTTYLFYRWEVIIRTTIVVGLVAAGGLGTEFRLSMSHFHYTRVTLLLLWYLVLVMGVDVAAGAMRRLAR